MNIKSAFHVPSPVNPKKMPDVPNLMDWRKIYGNDDYEGNHTHKHTTKFGEYHIQPAKDKAGKVVGYHLQFAHTGEGKPGQGMWTDLGVHSHPGKSIAAARKHHSAFSKQESLSEGEVKKANKAAKKARETDLGLDKFSTVLNHIPDRMIRGTTAKMLHRTGSADSKSIMSRRKAHKASRGRKPQREKGGSSELHILGNSAFKNLLRNRIAKAKQTRADYDRQGDATPISKI